MCIRDRFCNFNKPSSLLLNVILFRVPKVMLTMFFDSENAPSPTSKKGESPTVTVVKLVQSENAYPPMVVTLSGILTVSKLEHYWNAVIPMVVTLLGILTVSKLVHHRNE